MSLAEHVESDIVAALKQGRRAEVGALRLLKAAAKNAAVARGNQLTDEEYLAVIRSQVKQRREAIEAYDRAGRRDRADDERLEMTILERYLPTQLADDEIREQIEAAIVQTGAAGPTDMGRVMSQVMPQLQGKADGRRVNEMARELLRARGAAQSA